MSEDDDTKTRYELDACGDTIHGLSIEGEHMPMNLSDIHPTAREKVVSHHVRVEGRGIGTLRYFGDVHFASGVWCGVELAKNGTGMNDGLVKGTRYFL